MQEGKEPMKADQTMHLINYSRKLEPEPKKTKPRKKRTKQKRGKRNNEEKKSRKMVDLLIVNSYTSKNPSLVYLLQTCVCLVRCSSNNCRAPLAEDLIRRFPCACAVVY